MISFPRAALVALILSNHNVFAQTPMDFMPGTLVKLGVQFRSVNIDPPGSAVGGLDRESPPANHHLVSANSNNRSSNRADRHDSVRDAGWTQRGDGSGPEIHGFHDRHRCYSERCRNNSTTLVSTRSHNGTSSSTSASASPARHPSNSTTRSTTNINNRRLTTTSHPFRSPARKSYRRRLPRLPPNIPPPQSPKGKQYNRPKFPSQCS